MNQVRTGKLIISLTTVVIASFLLFACNTKSQSDETALAALALAAANSGSGSGTPVTQLVFFPTDNSGAGWGSGNLGGRSGADAKCASTKPAGLSCPNGNHALLSFSASDQVSNMPTNYGFSSSLPVKAWDGSAINATVLSQWSNMLSSSFGGPVFTVPLTTAFNIGGAPYFATGSHPDGSVDSTNNCSGFTSSGATLFADVDMGGQTFNPDGGVPSGDCSNFQSNFADVYLICVCY